MKPKIFTIAAMLLLATGSFYACQKNDENTDPVDIPFTEYSLAGTSCQWTNLNYDNKVIIINSNNELASYIACADGNYPAIDFSKHSLLLASGKTTKGISGIAKNLQQVTSKYVLDAEITLNNATIAQKWVIALVVDKLNNNNNVELNVTYKECTDCGDDDTVSIIGRWQFVQVKDFSAVFVFKPDAEELRCIDYSQYNIVYEFKADNILTVLGLIDNIDDYRGHEIGNHFYKINEFVIHSTTPYPYMLLIDDVLYMHGFYEKQLSIETEPYVTIEGDYIFTVYYFVKT